MGFASFYFSSSPFSVCFYVELNWAATVSSCMFKCSNIMFSSSPQMNHTNLIKIKQFKHHRNSIPVQSLSLTAPRPMSNQGSITWWQIGDGRRDLSIRRAIVMSNMATWRENFSTCPTSSPRWSIWRNPCSEIVNTPVFWRELSNHLTWWQWHWNLFIFCSCYVLSWFGFAVLWYLIAVIHGDLNLYDNSMSGDMSMDYDSSDSFDGSNSSLLFDEPRHVVDSIHL